MDMRKVTLEVVYTNSTQEFTPVTRVHPVNPLAKSAYVCRMPLSVLWCNSTHEFTVETAVVSRKLLQLPMIGN